VEQLALVLLDNAPALTVLGTGAAGVSATATPVDGGWAWAVGNDGPPAALRSVRATWDLGPAGGPVRVFCHGWQSWSACRTAVLGVDTDPAQPHIHPPRRQLQHADPEPASPRELRSESVVLVARPGRPLLCVGALGGSQHDTTFRLTLDDRDHVELTAEAVLGHAVLPAGAGRNLHQLVAAEGDDAHDLLAWWAQRFADTQGARAGAPYQVGWCSWYHWFTRVTEDDLHATLARSGEWPFEVIQLDDGYQHDIGDWLEPNETFPSGIPHVAEAIAAAGRTAGIWLAPFLAMGPSNLAARHPGWLARWHDGRPLIGNHNRAWGGSALALDLTEPEVLAHLEHVAHELVGMGFGYLKLDFLYAAAVPGVWRDPTRTPAERVRLGLDAIRRGAGPDVFLLGCGCPLAPAVGVVDGMRIGPDVEPSWGVPPHHQDTPPGYEATPPSTRNGYQATVTRAFLHRRWWLNDPDCLMLRHTATSLHPDAIETWARAVGLSGGMALVSDDLALLGPAERRLLDEVIAMGRAADTATGSNQPRCPDLLDLGLPRLLEGGGHRLELLDADLARSRLTPLAAVR
jgi:alpha-galactosidase